jgi:hypothetical protein
MQEKRELGVLFFSQKGERRKHVKIFHLDPDPEQDPDPDPYV